MTTYTYRASVLRNGKEHKVLKVLFDSELHHEWRCGNGVLDRENSTWEKINWSCKNGTMASVWTRTPPDGPIFFDWAPDACYGFYEQQEQQYWQDSSGPVYFDPLPEGYVMVQEDPYAARADPGAVQAGEVCLVPVDADASGQAAWSEQDHRLWDAFLNYGEQSEPMSSELITCAPSEEIHIASNRLDWTLSESWSQLRSMPRQSSVASPAFDVVGSPGMQLEFYPNGTKSTEGGFCTLQLTRGPESKDGIKFELCLNGQSNGPKACMGRRFLADYPTPSDEADDAKVTVSILILATF